MGLKFLILFKFWNDLSRGRWIINMHHTTSRVGEKVRELDRELMFDMFGHNQA